MAFPATAPDAASAWVINDHRVHITAAMFTDRVLLTVTALPTFGTIIAVTTEAYPDGTRFFSVRPLLGGGRDDDADAAVLCARTLGEAVRNDCDRDLLLCLGLPRSGGAAMPADHPFVTSLLRAILAAPPWRAAIAAVSNAAVAAGAAAAGGAGGAATSSAARRAAPTVPPASAATATTTTHKPADDDAGEYGGPPPGVTAATMGYASSVRGGRAAEAAGKAGAEATTHGTGGR